MTKLKLGQKILVHSTGSLGDTGILCVEQTSIADAIVRKSGTTIEMAPGHWGDIPTRPRDMVIITKDDIRPYFDTMVTQGEPRFKGKRVLFSVQPSPSISIKFVTLQERYQSLKDGSVELYTSEQREVKVIDGEIPNGCYKTIDEVYTAFYNHCIDFLGS